MIRGWMLKAFIQKALSILPEGERINSFLSSLRGGNSREVIAIRTLNLARKIGQLDEFKKLEGATVLEVGVGWLPIAPMLFFLAGAGRIIGVDRFRLIQRSRLEWIVTCLTANFDKIKGLLPVNSELLDRRLGVLLLSGSLEELEKNINFEYLAPADARTTGLSSRSVDLVFSYGVLEHLSPPSLQELNAEHQRILREDGVAYHWINLQDHYRNVDRNLSGVNFLQYSEAFWENFINSPIHYHNRLRKSDYLRIFQTGGGAIVHSEELIRESDLTALEKMKIDHRFRNYSQRDLAVYSLDVVLRYVQSA